MAAKDGEPSKIVYEVADLWFPVVILAQQGLHPDAVLAELARRLASSDYSKPSAIASEGI